MEKEIDVSNGTPEPKENGKEKETDKEDPQVATDTEKEVILNPFQHFLLLPKKLWPSFVGWHVCTV